MVVRYIQQFSACQFLNRVFSIPVNIFESQNALNTIDMNMVSPNANKMLLDD